MSNNFPIGSTVDQKYIVQLHTNQKKGYVSVRPVKTAFLSKAMEVNKKMMVVLQSKYLNVGLCLHHLSTSPNPALIRPMFFPFT
jgi:hypothetical protein